MGTVVEYEFPSIRAFLIGAASAAAISVLNKSEFLTKPREFSVSFLLLSFYSLYLWIYNLLKRGFHLNINDKWPTPTFFEALSLLIFNVGGIILALYWVGVSFRKKVDVKEVGDYLISFDYVDLALLIIFVCYTIYLLGKTYRGGWARCWNVIRNTVLNPRKVILDQIQADYNRFLEDLLKSDMENTQAGNSRKRGSISRDKKRIMELQAEIKDLVAQIERKSV